ncbi:MAG: hypothetical protein AAF245_03335, partial [Pseudomonadota bacterium]
MSVLRRGSFAATAALLLMALWAAPVPAVENRTVDRFLRLSDRFQTQLPRSEVKNLPQSAKRARAVCILSRFEEGFGADGVRALMNLMNVLSTGAEFDDPTIVAFNE